MNRVSLIRKKGIASKFSSMNMKTTESTKKKAKLLWPLFFSNFESESYSHSPLCLWNKFFTTIHKATLIAFASLGSLFIHPLSPRYRTPSIPLSVIYCDFLFWFRVDERAVKMGLSISRIMKIFFSKKEMRILMVGLDAAGKTTILYKLKLGEIVTTIPTIGNYMTLILP